MDSDSGVNGSKSVNVRIQSDLSSSSTSSHENENTTTTYGTNGNMSRPYQPKRRMTIIAVVVATIGSFGLGNVLVWSAIALKDIKESKYFGDFSDEEFDNISSWIGSTILLGALISAPLTGFFISAIGRRKTMLITALPCLLGWLLIAFAQNLAMIYTGRFITGFCGGSFTVAVPAYVSEVTEDRIRGTLGTVMILMLVTGIEFTFIVGAFVSWFWLSIVCAIVPVIFFISMLFMPESPRYLLIKRQPSAARRALKWLRRASTKRHIEPEINKIEDSVAANSRQSSKLSDLITPSVLKPIGISIALMFFAQLSGVNGLSLFTVQAFEDAGTEMDARFASIIIGGCQALTVLFVPFVLVDTLGRKTLLLVSELIMIVGLIAFGTYYYLKGDAQASPEGMGWLPLTSLVTIFIGYNIGMGPLPWVVTSEILPHHVRELASSLIVIAYWSLSFVAGITFKTFNNLLGNYGFYWLCTGICVLGSLFIIFLVPETKGKTSEEIENFFGKTSSPDNNKKDLEFQNEIVLSTNPNRFQDDIETKQSDGGLDNPAFDNQIESGTN